MSKFIMTMAGSVLGTGFLVPGFLVLGGSGIASAQPVGGSACQQVEATMSSIQSQLPAAAANPSALKSKISAFATELNKEAASGPPALKSAVGKFLSDIQAGESSGFNVSKLTADGNAIGAACASQSAPGGAPGTGGGSTAGTVDPALYAAGGAVVLAGLGVLGYGSRRRRGANQDS